MTRLIAPILSFTADEVWGYLPKLESREASVHLATFPDLSDIIPGNEEAIKADWEKLLAIREQVLAKLELLRADKIIGKPLEATVTLNPVPQDTALLTNYSTALAELFNVSDVQVQSGPGPVVSVTRSTQPKCERCWRYVSDVGEDDQYPTVCLRCADALGAIHFAPYAAIETQTPTLEPSH